MTTKHTEAEASELKEIHRFSSTNKFTTDGKAICCLCGFSDHDLRQHVQEKHSISPEQYIERYASEGWSLDGKNFGIAETLSYKDREKKQFSVLETFGFWWGKNEDGKPYDRKVIGYAEAGSLTPKADDGYVFSEEHTRIALMGMHYRDHMLTVGPTGSGKSSLWQQIAARLNYNFVRINFDGGITRSDLVGQWVVKGSTMVFQYGILPSAMALGGTIVCLDEWDAIGEEVSFVLQRPLEADSQLLLLEKGEELVTLHPDNVIVATANTNGMGDDTGLYATGTRVQNYAQINRFNLTILLDYLAPEQEEMILLKRYKEEISPIEAKFMVKVVNAVREAFARGRISAPLSTRDLINWAEKFIALGDAKKAAKYCFVNRMPTEERGVLFDLIERAMA